jgi:hypothetical protein
MGMGLVEHRCDRDDERPQLAREVLPPREALCDTCVGAARRRGAISRAIWIAAVIVAIAHLLESWS